MCPEILGGFSTPREPAEIVGGNGEDVLDGKAKVIEKTGRDVARPPFILNNFRFIEVTMYNEINYYIK